MDVVRLNGYAVGAVFFEDMPDRVAVDDADGVLEVVIAAQVGGEVRLDPARLIGVDAVVEDVALGRLRALHGFVDESADIGFLAGPQGGQRAAVGREAESAGRRLLVERGVGVGDAQALGGSAARPNAARHAGAGEDAEAGVDAAVLVRQVVAGAEQFGRDDLVPDRRIGGIQDPVERAVGAALLKPGAVAVDVEQAAAQRVGLLGAGFPAPPLSARSSRPAPAPFRRPGPSSRRP